MPSTKRTLASMLGITEAQGRKRAVNQDKPPTVAEQRLVKLQAGNKSGFGLTRATRNALDTARRKVKKQKQGK